MPVFDPTLPAANSPISSGELRDQLNALNSNIVNVTNDVLDTALSTNSVSILALTISDPPTQAEAQAIHDKINEMLSTMKR